MSEQPISGGHVVTKNKVDLATELRARISQALHSRKARRGTVAAKVEGGLKSGGLRLWRVLERRPLVGSALVGGAGLAVATAIGATELTLGLLVGYAAYQVLREGVPPREAAERMVAELQRAG